MVLSGSVIRVAVEKAEASPVATIATTESIRMFRAWNISL